MGFLNLCWQSQIMPPEWARKYWKRNNGRFRKGKYYCCCKKLNYERWHEIKSVNISLSFFTVFCSFGFLGNRKEKINILPTTAKDQSTDERNILIKYGLYQQVVFIRFQPLPATSTHKHHCLLPYLQDREHNPKILFLKQMELCASFVVSAVLDPMHLQLTLR